MTIGDMFYFEPKISFLSRSLTETCRALYYIILGRVGIPQLVLTVTMHEVNERAWEDLMGWK